MVNVENKIHKKKKSHLSKKILILFVCFLSLAHGSVGFCFLFPNEFNSFRYFASPETGSIITLVTSSFPIISSSLNDIKMSVVGFSILETTETKINTIMSTKYHVHILQVLFLNQPGGVRLLS